MNPETVNLEKNNTLICPTCGEQIKHFAGVTPGHSQEVRKGQIFICSHCQNVSRVGDSNLEIVTETQFREMPRHIQEGIQAVVQALQQTSSTNRGN